MTKQSVAITSGPTFSRRQVLAGLMSAGVVTIVGSSPVASAMRALAVPGSGDDRVLVNLFLRGGADGLNIVVPHGDDDYYRLRSSIAQAKSTLSDLDGFFGLNQAFAPLHPLYQEGELAFIQAVGSNDKTRSHFSAMDNMDLAFGNTGWMQRALAVQAGQDPLAGLTVGDRVSPSLRGAGGGIALKSLRNFRQANAAMDFMRPTLESMYGATPYRLIGDATARAYTSIDRLANVSVESNVDYPRGRIAQDLREAAALIKANVGVRMVSINFGGWDHHTDEVDRMTRKGAELAAALAAFKADLGSESDRVLTMVMSEFGRTARQNGSGGTDHGHGNMMMVMGGGLASAGGGKVHVRNNSWVGLSSSDLYQNRDLAISTDFRSVLAESLDKHMGIADDGRIFPRYTAEYLGLLSGGGAPTTTTTVPTGSSTTTSTIVATSTTSTPSSTTSGTSATTTTTAPPGTGPSVTQPSTTQPPQTTAPPTTISPTTSPPTTIPSGFVTGTVKYTNGTPAANIQIDLFRDVEGERNGFLGTARTDASGEYEIVSPGGPHILTFIAPTGDEFIEGRKYHQPSVTVASGQTTSGVNAVLLGANLPGSGSIGGTVTDAQGSAVQDLKVDLYAAQGDGSRGRFLRYTKTGTDGSFRFGTPSGCYVLTMIAPENRLFTNGKRWYQPSICIEASETALGLDAQLDS